MRYSTSQSAAARQARSLRIGRCARCHAPILAGEDHYGDGDGDVLVHAACAVAPADPDGERERQPQLTAAQQPCRTRRPALATGGTAAVAAGRL